MAPRGKKGRKGEEKVLSQTGGSVNSPPLRKNPQMKKANKKEADKHVNAGAKLMKKAEGETGRKKVVTMRQAKVQFEQALTFMEGHADAMYNLAIAELELTCDICNDESTSEAIILDRLTIPCDILTAILANDTSGRGETTGLAHRLLANIYCRYHEAMSIPSGGFHHLVEKIRAHIGASVTILANHSDLDTLLFECCQLFQGMMSAHMTSTVAESDLLSALIAVAENITFLREQVNFCLQTPQSSGIDMEVKLLDGSALIEVAGVMVSALSSSEDIFSRDKVVVFLEDHPRVGVFIQECILAALQLHDALVSFVPDDCEVQRVAADLIQSAVELSCSVTSLRGESNDTVFWLNNGSSSEGLLDLQRWLLKLITCRCIGVMQVCSANNLLALGDDLKAAAEYMNSRLFMASVESNDGEALPSVQSWSKFIRHAVQVIALRESGEKGLKELLQKQSRAVSALQGKGDGAGETELFLEAEEPLLNGSHCVMLYSLARRCYEEALCIYYSNKDDDGGDGVNAIAIADVDADDDDDDEPDNISTIHYNLLCVLWKLKESDTVLEPASLCRHHFKRYMAIEIESSGRENVVSQLVQGALGDSDLEGVCDCLWFAEESQAFIAGESGKEI